MMLLPVCDKGKSTLYPKIADKDINFFGNVKSHEWRMLQKWQNPKSVIRACGITEF